MSDQEGDKDSIEDESKKIKKLVLLTLKIQFLRVILVVQAIKLALLSFLKILCMIIRIWGVLS